MCKMKPVFIESGRAHDYCSRTCASDYEGRKLQACLLEDCKLTGRSAHADFCSDQHAKDGVRKGQVAGCLTCGIYPQASQNGQCVSCQRQPSASPAPRSTNSDRLEEVKAGSSEFKRVRKHFASQWDPADKAKDAVPTLDKVYKVTSTTDDKNKFRLQQQSKKSIFTFHSAQCICNLGTKAPDVCDFKSCGICNIVKSSFHSFEFGIPHNVGRFGDGVYSNTCAKLADQHATSCTSSPYRVMISCEVAVDPNNKIDDAESVYVPTADAILPRFILMYQK
ncbi:hypothetical protein CPB85DRAFT_1553180 [Mucidula mucida]|nr:hypothetical protein CPB85DRAFT_1553180 [Mucidula mucida]